MSPGSKVEIVRVEFARDAFGRPVRYEVARVTNKKEMRVSRHFITAIYDWKKQAERWEYSWFHAAMASYGRGDFSVGESIVRHMAHNKFKAVRVENQEVLM